MVGQPGDHDGRVFDPGRAVDRRRDARAELCHQGMKIRGVIGGCARAVGIAFALHPDHPGDIAIWRVAQSLDRLIHDHRAHFARGFPVGLAVPGAGQRRARGIGANQDVVPGPVCFVQRVDDLARDAACVALPSQNDNRCSHVSPPVTPTRETGNRRLTQPLNLGWKSQGFDVVSTGVPRRWRRAVQSMAPSAALPCRTSSVSCCPPSARRGPARIRSARVRQWWLRVSAG